LENKEFFKEVFEIKEEIYEYVNKIDKNLIEKFSELDEIEEFNQLKVLKAMQDVNLAATDFAWSTGYGYGDVGREKVEKIFAKIFKAEDSLVRPAIASGTHALALTLQGILLPGDEVISITDKPYDTLQSVIGISGDEVGTLKEFGISYNDVPLLDGKIQIKKALDIINSKTKMVMIQRSTGYSLRNAIQIKEIKEAITEIKNIYPEVIIMVDNCYGEFTNKVEPIEVGADLCVGSLIKNPGGGIAVSGGYIVGKEKLIQRIANRLTAPGLGKETGLSFGQTRNMLQGLFLAPKVTMQALKGALLFGNIFNSLGFETIPKVDDKRSDIIQAIIFNDPNKVIEFCRGIQEASAVDSHVTPYPWPMPGYTDEVIMASGSFIEGSSIEISADGPLREPYVAYYQGGLSYYQCKLAAMIVLKRLIDKKLIKIK